MPKALAVLLNKTVLLKHFSFHTVALTSRIIVCKETNAGTCKLPYTDKHFICADEVFDCYFRYEYINQKVLTNEDYCIVVTQPHSGRLRNAYPHTKNIYVL